MTEILTLKLDASNLVKCFKDAAVHVGYEVTLPAGNVLLYGLEDEGLVGAFVDQLGQDAVEAVYKFNRDKPDPAQPELFES